MENIELFNKTIVESKIKSVEVKENILITFEDGRVIKINDYHNQDCCESVYADYSIYKLCSSELVGKEINNIVIKGVEGMGFLVCLGKKESYSDYIDNFSKVFIPCYNSQNGYYSSNLELQITCDGVEIKLDISNLVEDHIN